MKRRVTETKADSIGQARSPLLSSGGRGCRQVHQLTGLRTQLRLLTLSTVGSVRHVLPTITLKRLEMDSVANTAPEQIVMTHPLFGVVVEGHGRRSLTLFQPLQIRPGRVTLGHASSSFR
jgi:hypothetical protein